MDDVIFIGDRRDAAGFYETGIRSYVPEKRHLAERVVAERLRCKVMAMTEITLAALPSELARELRESSAPRLAIVPPLMGRTRCRLPDEVQSELVKLAS